MKAFAAPPADEEYNKTVENHPDFPKAAQFTNILNIAGGCTLLVPVLLYMRPDMIASGSMLFKILIALSVVLMPASILLVLFFRGLVWYNIRSTVPHPSPFFALFVPAISLTVTGAMNSFTGYGQLFLMACPIALVFWVAMLITTKEFKAYTKLDFGNMGALLFTCYVFGFGAYTSTNCMFDNTEPQSFLTSITKKEIYEDRDHEESFYLHFKPVANIDASRIEVSRSLYESVNETDNINFKLRAGLWGSPWYYLDKVGGE